MSACAQPITKSPRKSAPNLHRRDPESRTEQERRRTGWSKLPHSWFADMARISRGKAQLLLMLYGWSQSSGKPRKKGEAAPDWTGELTYDDLAQIAGCTTRQVFDDLKDAHDRQVLEVKPVGKGKVVFRVLAKKWKDLLDYRPPIIAQPDDTEDDAEEEQPTVAIAKTATRLLRHPLAVAPEKATRAIPVNCGVKSIRLQNTSAVRLGFDIVVQAGEMLVITQPPPEKPVAHVSGQTSRVNNLEKFPGSALPVPGADAERIGQLRDLFEPIWRKHFRPSVPKPDLLSKVSVTLQDVPVAFYGIYVDRTFKRRNYPFAPGLVVTIADEAVAEWKANAGEEWRREQNRHANDKFGASAPSSAEMTPRQAHNFIRAHEAGEHVDADLLAEARRALAKEEAPC